MKPLRTLLDVSKLAAWLWLVLSIVSCEDSFMKQATANKMGAVTNLQTTVDSEGNFIAQIDPTKSETQLMRVTQGAIAGAAVAIPPAALSIPVSIMVGEGVALTTNSFRQDLGLTTNPIKAGGPSVSFTASQDVVATNPLTLSIPFGALAFALADVNTENLIVMYRLTTLKDGEPSYEVGVIPGDKVTRGQNKVSFQTTKFGTFQVGIAETKITRPLLAATEEPPALKSCERYAAAAFPACTQDGQVGCVTTDSFKAADMNLVRPEVILAQKKIANITGNVTLPPPGHVLSGTSYGSIGSQNLGTLLLPSPEHVLSIAGPYGDPSAALTPMVANRGSWDLSTSFPGAGYYTGTSEIPAADSYTGTLFGTAGTATLSPANCSFNGQQSCVATGTYFAGIACAVNGSNCFLPAYSIPGLQTKKAIDFATIDSSKMLDTLTVSGVQGTISSKGSWDITTAFPGPGYYTGTNTPPAASTYTGTMFGTSGTAVLKPADCSIDGSLGCVTTADFPAVAKAGAASKIIEGQTLGGVSGNVLLPSQGDVRLDVTYGSSNSMTGTLDPGAGAPASCMSENETNCVATSNYPSVDKARIAANTGKFLGDFAVAGISGALSTCATDGSGCFLPAYSPPTQPLKAINYNSIDPMKMLNTLTLSGVQGTISSKGSWDITTAFPGPGYYTGTNTPPAASTYTGTLFGTAGTATLSPGNCSSNGQQSCVATGTYFAGTACSANGSACYLPTYVLTTQPLKAINYDAINSSASSIRTSATLGGVTGTLADCATNAATGCVTTAAYKSADLTNLSAGNIKSGVTIASTVGQYPNATYPLTGSSGTDLTSATFNAQIKSSATFQYFSSDGTRHTGTGDPDIMYSNIKAGVDIFGTTGSLATPEILLDPWDLRAGASINGIVGKLKVNCRNRVNSAIFNYDGAISGIGQSGMNNGSTMDVWDTIDDYNNNSTGMPPSRVNDWSINFDCGGVETTVWDDNVWKDVTTTSGGAASSCATEATRCTMQDKITGLRWSRLQSSQTWNAAWNHCQTTSHNGQSGWRLPTQKELMEAYTHGIKSAALSNWIPGTNMNNYFWSGSSASSNTSSAWHMNIANGQTNQQSKSVASQVVCVR